MEKKQIQTGCVHVVRAIFKRWGNGGERKYGGENVDERGGTENPLENIFCNEFRTGNFFQ